MATGTNGIATIADCNSIVSGAFTTGSATVTGTAQTSSSTISSSSSTVYVNTTGFKYVNSSSTYRSITATTPMKLTITVTNALLRYNSTSGSVITNFNTISKGMIRVGLTTSSSSTTFSHYVDIAPDIGNNYSTVAVLEIPIGSWYIRANCIEAPCIYNPQTSSGSVTGTLYYSWQIKCATSRITTYCPTYSIIDETGEFSISGSYADDQCVKYSDIRVYTAPAGYITYTQNSNKTSNVIGFTYSGSNYFSGSTINDWENFKDQYCGSQYMSTPSSVGTGVYRLTIGSGADGDLTTWQSGYYYLVTAPTNYMVEEIHLTSTQASQLNAGTNLSLSGSGTLLSNY